MLQKENISVVGTIRPLGINFLALLIILYKNWLAKLDWGTTIIDIVNNVLCISWQDNNFVLGLSIVHTIHQASSWVELEYKRPSKTSTNLAITQKVFGNSLSMLLDILT